MARLAGRLAHVKSHDTPPGADLHPGPAGWPCACPERMDGSDYLLSTEFPGRVRLCRGMKSPRTIHLPELRRPPFGARAVNWPVAYAHSPLSCTSLTPTETVFPRIQACFCRPRGLRFCLG